MHDWQYTDGRKVIMEESEGQCPAQCGALEDSMHFLVCHSEVMRMWRYKHMRLLKKQLGAINTYPGIIAAVTRALTSGWEEQWIQEMPTDTWINMKLLEAITTQASIQQQYLAQGYIVSEWSAVQHRWDKASGASKDNFSWGMELVTCLHAYVISCWKERNEVEHGAALDENKMQRKKKIMERVRQLYNKRRHKVTKQERTRFNI